MPIDRRCFPNHAAFLEDATVTVSRAEWRKVQQQVSLLTAIVAENARKFTSVIDTTNTTARRIEQLFAYLRIGGEKSVTVNLTSSFKVRLSHFAACEIGTYLSYHVHGNAIQSEVRRRLAMLLDWCDLYPGKAKMFALLNDIPPPIGLDAIDLEVCKKQVLKYVSNDRINLPFALQLYTVSVQVNVSRQFVHLRLVYHHHERAPPQLERISRATSVRRFE